MSEFNEPRHYLAFLTQYLTNDRIEHSHRVMQVMMELAPVYNLDPIQAMTAGLLHDAAKDLPVEEQLALAKEAGIDFKHPCERHPVYLHTFVGAYLVSSELEIKDRQVLDAITFHSFAGQGENFDSPLSRCLRFADVLSPMKSWQGMEKLKRLVFRMCSDEAALLHCAWLIEYMLEQQIPVHPNINRLYQSLSTKLAVTDDFFER